MTEATPLWEQVLADLRSRLEAGEFDDRFPTDRELVSRYGVSRHTVRQAVRSLQDAGVVVRHRGVGSYRATTAFEQPLGTLYSLFRSIESGGAEQTSVVLQQGIGHDEQAATRLDLTASEELFHLERIRLADGEPLALDRVWLPLRIARPLLDTHFARTSVYDELAATKGIRPEQGFERIRPVVPDPGVAVQLDLDPGSAAFEIERTTEWNGRPLEWRVTVIRGDRYAFTVDWDPLHPSNRPELRPAP